ncbi:hypothetical protein M231_04505 [Tremella mesenterica]|uniref:Uncharacterized protein n=1 Tax=Tremella mesenterica TaxID=5217 RepID=A0A4Q1BKC0_TREME|nr:hypothetical protein M231_04505 [Tremella mesenterica]
MSLPSSALSSAPDAEVVSGDGTKTEKDSSIAINSRSASPTSGPLALSVLPTVPTELLSDTNGTKEMIAAFGPQGAEESANCMKANYPREHMDPDPLNGIYYQFPREYTLSQVLDIVLDWKNSRAQKVGQGDLADLKSEKENDQSMH